MLLAKTEMAESGLAGRFWYSATDFSRVPECYLQAATGSNSACQDIWSQEGYVEISTLQMPGLPALEQRREPGKHAPRAVEAIHLGFASDMSCPKFWVPSTSQLVYTNQAKFDEGLFLYRNKEMIEGRLA